MPGTKGHSGTNPNSRNNKKIFSDSEKDFIVKEFKNGIILTELGQKFGCSHRPIGRILIEILGKEKYTIIAKEHLRKSQSKNGKQTGPKNILKGVEVSAKLSRSEKQIIQCKDWVKAGQEASAKGVWISSWEDKFYEKILIPGFVKLGYKVERQFYLKDLNHAFDLAIPELKFLFEIDGNHWHKDRKERDAEIDKFAEDNNWIVFRYHDEDLEKMEII